MARLKGNGERSSVSDTSDNVIANNNVNKASETDKSTAKTDAFANSSKNSKSNLIISCYIPIN